MAQSAKVIADQELTKAANTELRTRSGDLAKLRDAYMNEKQVPVYLSPMYRPYFGKTMNVDINGISIFIPVNGTTFNVPQTFSDEIVRRRMAIDAMLTRQDRMAAISTNAEGSPGELKLF